MSFANKLGTSMAALNAFIMALTYPGEEESASIILNKIWSNLSNDQVYQRWKWGYIEGFFFRNALFDNEPFSKTLENISKMYGGKYKRKLVIGMADINAGVLRTATESIPIERMLTFIKAAASSPGFFPPVTDGLMLLVDGSTIVSLDAVSAIDRCRELVDDDESIVLDLIMVNRIRNLSKDCGKMTGMEMLSRYVLLSLLILSIVRDTWVCKHYARYS